jgi:hypothetical protein
MGLTIAQKSVYIIIYNATMIWRSIGKTITKNQILPYKKALFKEVGILCAKMDKELLSNYDIVRAIEKLCNKFEKLSFGQSQKGINVILKYHFLLSHNNGAIKMVLDCP